MPSNYASNAPRVTQRPDGTYELQEHGNTRALVGDEVGRAQAYAKEFEQKFPTGYQPDNPNSLNDAYRQYTGRDGDAAGLAAHRRNPGGFTGAINAIAGSEEARNYAARSTNPNQDALQNALSGKRDQWSGAGTVTSRGDLARLEGFDAKNFGDDGMQTAKYQAGRIFSRFNPDDPNALAAILSDPEFKRLFPNAKGVGPDKIDFGDGRPVDVIRGHGAPGAKFSWQTMDGVTTPSAPGATASVRPPTSNTMPVVSSPIAGQQSDLMEQIMAALQAQQNPDGQDLLQQAMR